MLLIAVSIAFVGCTTESVDTEDPTLENTQQLDTNCTGDDPKAMITNDSDTTVDMEIFDEDGNLLNHSYAVEPGEESDWKFFAEGQVTVVISTESSYKAIPMNMGLCMAYHVTINENYQLDTDQPTQL